MSVMTLFFTTTSFPKSSSWIIPAAWAPILAIGVLQQALHCFTPHFYLSAIELCLSLGLSLIAFLVGRMVRRVRGS